MGRGAARGLRGPAGGICPCWRLAEPGCNPAVLSAEGENQSIPLGEEKVVMCPKPLPEPSRAAEMLRRN